MTRNILSRLHEPSTWGGLSILLMMFGVSTNQAQAVADLLAAAAAAASVFLPENSNRDPPGI